MLFFAFFGLGNKANERTKGASGGFVLAGPLIESAQGKGGKLQCLANLQEDVRC